MAKVDVSCPRCGKESTGYVANRWKCLHCGGRFIYDPKAPEKELSVDSLRKVVLCLVIVSALGASLMATHLESRSKERKAEIEVRRLEAQARLVELGATTNRVESTREKK